MSYLEQLISAADSHEELSEQGYNFTLGLMLAWGFFLNFVILEFIVPAYGARIYGMRSDSSLIFYAAYFVLVMIGNKLLHSGSVPTCFLGYNLIALPVGLLASLAVGAYSSAIVTQAILITAIAVLSMMIAATLRPAFFAKLGSGLATALLCTLIAEVAGTFIFRAHFGLLDGAIVAIMSLYIGFDWVRANSVPRTVCNAICVSSALYMDIINILLRVLRILGNSKKNRS